MAPSIPASEIVAVLPGLIGADGAASSGGGGAPTPTPTPTPSSGPGDGVASGYATVAAFSTSVAAAVATSTGMATVLAAAASAARGAGLAAGTSIVTGVAVPSSGIPAAANLIMSLDASDITPQTDNTNLASWPDSTGGLAYAQATSGNQPKYRSAASGVGAGGRPCVQFAGNQFLTSLKAGSAIQTAMAANNYTLLIVMHGVQVQSNATPYTTHNSTTGIYMRGNGTGVGQQAAFFQADVETLGDWVNFGQTCAPTGIEATRGYVNGGIVSQAGAYYGTGAYADLSVGMSPTIANNGLKGYIDAIYAWNRRLTPLEMLQLDDWCRTRWAQPDIRPSGSRFTLYEGDSITAGVSANSSYYSYPNITRQAKGRLHGQWSNFGVGGSTWTGIQSRQAEMTAVVNYLTARGVIVDLAVWEFYNSKATTLSTLNTQINSYLTAAYASGVTNITFGTTCDYTGAGAEKAAFTSYWDISSNQTGLMNGYVPIHLDTNIGVNGANASATYFAGDHVHLTGVNNFPTVQSGYPVLASLFTAAMP